MFRRNQLTVVSLALLMLLQVAPTAGRAQEPVPSKDLNAPTKEVAQSVPEPLLVIVQTTEDGSLRELIVREDEDEVTIKTLKALSRYLRRVHLDKESPDVVVIQVDPKTKYFIVKDVAGACAKAGYQKIQFAAFQPPQ